MSKVQPDNESDTERFASAKISKFFNFSNAAHNVIFEQFRRSNISLMVLFVFQLGFCILVMQKVITHLASDPNGFSIACCVFGVLFCFVLGWDG